MTGSLEKGLSALLAFFMAGDEESREKSFRFVANSINTPLTKCFPKMSLSC